MSAAADLQVTAQSLASLLHGLAPAPALAVTGVEADSRRIRGGELFLACAGHASHGLDHLADALERGAAAVAYEPDAGRRLPAAPVPMLPVPGLSRVAGLIGARWYGRPSERLYTVGVTGTDGKTSTCYLLAQAFDALGLDAGYIGTLGAGRLGQLADNPLTTPAPLDLQRLLAELVSGGARAAAIEASSIGIAQARIAGVSFDVAVLTNIGRDHLDYHGDLARYVAAKRELFEQPGLRVAVLNRDDRYGRAWAHEMAAGIESVAYGVGGRPSLPGRYVIATDVRPRADGLDVTLQSSWGEAQLRSTLIGRFNVYNLLAVLSVLLVRGSSLGDAVDALAEVRTVPGRMEPFRRDDGVLFLVDYAHTPQALAAALSAAREHTRGRLICVFGCGGDRDPGKRAPMGAAAAEYADQLIITSDNPRSEDPQAIIDAVRAGVAAGVPVEGIVDRREAIERAAGMAQAGDVVLVAGKGHERTQIIGGRVLPFCDRAVVRECGGVGA